MANVCQSRQNILLCVICNQQLHHPKTLPCMHACCIACLREFIYSRLYDAVGHFPCPVCRQMVLLPPGGVADLPDKFHVVGVLDSISLQHEVLEKLSSTSTDLRYCFGHYGSKVTDLFNPGGLCIKQNGDIVVSDSHRNRLLTFDLRGQVKGVFSCQHGLGDIAVTNQDTIIAACFSSGRALAIEYNNSTGVQLRKFGTFTSLDPGCGVAVTSCPFQVVVSSCDTRTLYVLDEGGRLIRMFNKRSLIGKPYHIATNSRGDLVVSDYVNSRITVLDRLTGKCLAQMGKVGTEPGCLYQPRGIAVDEHDDIIIADSGNHRVALFSSTGKFRGIVIDMSRSFGKPVNVAYLPGSGILVVLATGQNYAQVRVYSYVSTKDCSPVIPFGCWNVGQTV